MSDKTEQMRAQVLAFASYAYNLGRDSAGFNDAAALDKWAALSSQSQPTVAQLAIAKDDLVPGKMHCARCDFSLIRKTLFLKSGTVGAGGNETEPCPNGCGPLWPITWEQEAREGYEIAEQLLERAKVAEEALATLPSQQQGAQPDHIADANEMVEQPASPSSAPATADDQQVLSFEDRIAAVKPEVSSEPTDRELLQMALDALEYHVEQTRPIQRTANAIEALRARLASTVAQQPVVPSKITRKDYPGYAPPEDGNAEQYYADGWNDCVDAIIATMQSSAAQSREKKS